MWSWHDGVEVELKLTSANHKEIQLNMKKIMSLMLGLSLIAGVAAFADDAATTSTKTKKTHTHKTHTKKEKAANTGS